MKTIADIRLDNLRVLVEECGTQDALALKTGTSPVYLSQLINQALDSKTGAPRKMGDETARKIELGCKREVGWMDNVHYHHPQIELATRVMEQMEDWQLEQALKILDALAQPKPKEGNGE